MKYLLFYFLINIYFKFTLVVLQLQPWIVKLQKITKFHANSRQHIYNIKQNKS